MSTSLDLSDLQAALMRVLWERQEVTATEAHEALWEERRLAPTTVSTLLSRLEKRGLVTHRTLGRQFVYRPTVSEGEVRRSMVSELAARLFEGDVTALVSHLIAERDVSPGDLGRVKQLIEQMEGAARKSHRTGRGADPDQDPDADPAPNAGGRP